MLAPQFISGPQCKRPDPPRKQRAGTCHQHQPPGSADDQSSDSTNPHSAPLGVYFGSVGRGPCLPVLQRPRGASPAICGCAEKLLQEGGRQKEKPPTARKPP